MQEPSFKFCPACGTQNHISAQFCQACGSQVPAIPATPVVQKQPKKQNGMTLLIICGIAVFGCAGLTAIGSLLRSGKNVGSTSFATPAPYSAPLATPAPVASGERMVLDNSQVTAYVECTNREWKQYKFRFIVKKSGSPFLTPILRQVGNPNAYSVVVNGVDTGDGDLAFSPNIAAFDRNGKLITADFNTRPLNGNEALGRAYYNLIAKYERGD